MFVYWAELLPEKKGMKPSDKKWTRLVEYRTKVEMATLEKGQDVLQYGKFALNKVTAGPCLNFPTVFWFGHGWSVAPPMADV